ncbi:hypothetical protein HU675_0020020 [Bradyrhizobium septentrionale]|uniref:hypothetical protein n=1 Tax=Bradyrhizobium septentrionale TaxID=1404411 RepID=UPI0015970D7E|nr:hypothetical protein [Bradyrhizobium septentrionale]UGY28870.1 hypothetical protein HU675_0020020 [Bradyrhizobium septentrionale]
MSLFKETKIQEQEEFAEGDLLSAFETSHKRHRVDEDDEELVMSDDIEDLSAVNTRARLCWARHLCRLLERAVGFDSKSGLIEQDVFLVSLVDIRCAKGSAEENVDLEPIKKRLRQGLRGYNYIGAIEPALYSSITWFETNFDRQRCISWHLHALVWGVSRGEIKTLVRRLRRSGDYIPITPAQLGADVRSAIQGKFSGLIGYVLKPPTHSYRIGIDRVHERQTGEIRHKQYRSRLRPGERLTLYLQMRHLDCDQMWIAGGGARQIRSRCRRDALAAVRRSDRDQIDIGVARHRPRRRLTGVNPIFR